MFSSEKCVEKTEGFDGHLHGANAPGLPAAELLASMEEALSKEGLARDELVNAVAAASDEIGDILRDELGDADRAELIGSELADLSAELGLLAGLADGEPHKAPFSSLLDIAMGHRDSSASSSSSTWSGGRGSTGRSRRPPRPPRANRKRTISKGKEIVRRRAAVRRASTLDARRVEVVSEEQSDVGADTDSDDQWTELDDACSSESGSSSVKELEYPQAGMEPERPPMGQFLLPLLTADTAPLDNMLIRHEDILQLLASVEQENASGESLEPSEDTDMEPYSDKAQNAELFICEVPKHVTLEEEAAVLRYVCEAELLSEADKPKFCPVEEWLLGMYHLWCEINALMYTMIGLTNCGLEQEAWLYRPRFSCHCRLCVSLGNNAEPLEHFVNRTLFALAKGEKTMCDAVSLQRCLGLHEPGAPLQPHCWQLAQPLLVSHEGAMVIRKELEDLCNESELCRELVEKGCLCRPRITSTLDDHWAVACFFKLLEGFKIASTMWFKVDILPEDGGPNARIEAAAARLARHLAPYRRMSTAARLADMASRTHAAEVSAWSQYRHHCNCLNPRTLNAQQRRIELRLSFLGLMQALKQLGGSDDSVKPPCEDGSDIQGQPGTEICPKPPEADQVIEELPTVEAGNSLEQVQNVMEFGEESDGGSGTGSLGLSTSSTPDSASELLLAAAAAVESASDTEAAPGELCRTVRHLMRSIASIERLMDRVLRRCLASATPNEQSEDRKNVDLGLSQVDRKLMTMYRQLPEVHQQQLQVYRKQKKLSTVCMQLVGGTAPAPPPPGSPPPGSPPHTPRALCPEYHLQRFKEVRRKVMHMRDQQLYYHRLRMWMEDQLQREKEGSAQEGAISILEELNYPRKLRRNTSPKNRKTAATKRKLRPHPSMARPILHMLKTKSLPDSKSQDPVVFGQDVQDGSVMRAEENSEVDPPEVFCYPENTQDGLSDTETVVGEKDADLCKEMKDCLARFANFALNAPEAHPNISTETPNDNPTAVESEIAFPDSISPPLQEMSPTAEPLPVYKASTKSSQRLLAVNKLLNRSATMLDRLKDDIRADFDKNAAPIEFDDSIIESELAKAKEIIGKRNKALLVDGDDHAALEKLRELSENTDKSIEILTQDSSAIKDPNIYKYVTFGLEIKKAIEECQNIINSCNSYIKVTETPDVPAIENVASTATDIPKEEQQKDEQKDSDSLSFEQIYEAIMSLEKNTTDILECIDKNETQTENTDGNVVNTKLAEIVENMPQILANMPEIATKLSEFANASFELPEFATIMNSIPDLGNEAQLTPETLKQIRELKINKIRDTVKVTKNTAKRKIRKIRNNIDNDVIGTITFDFDGKDITEILRDEKELQAHLKKSNHKGDYKELLFSIVTNKVFEYIKHTNNPDLVKCLEEEWKVRELLEMPKNVIQLSEDAEDDSLFDNSVKDALSMDHLKELVRTRFDSWKHYAAVELKKESQDFQDKVNIQKINIDKMIEKIYIYIKAIDENIQENVTDRDNDDSRTDIVKFLTPCECLEKRPTDVESLRQIMKFIKESVGSTIDIIIMQIAKMSKDRKKSLKHLKFKYMDVIRRCGESTELINWIMSNPEIAVNVILEMTGLTIDANSETVDVTNLSYDKRQEYFIRQVRLMNEAYMKTMPKEKFSGDCWLVMLYRLEQWQIKLNDALHKAQNPVKPAPPQSNISETREAELLAGKGLSKIINKANATKNQIIKKPANIEPPKSPVKKTEEPIKPVPKTDIKPEVSEADRKARNEALLAKCEAILTSKGEKSLLESFYTIKSYITQGLPVPESYKKHVISICSSIDAKLLDEDIEETLSKGKVLEQKTEKAPPVESKPVEEKITKCCHETDESGSSSPICCPRDPKTGKHFAILGSQNPELLAKYSAQALRNAKQSLNAVAFNSIRNNARTKSDGDQNDCKKLETDCKWTNDCICSTCKTRDPNTSICLGDIVKQYETEKKEKTEAKPCKAANKDTKPLGPKPQVKVPPKAPPKLCENITHQQHVCKIGHNAPSCGSDHQNGAAGPDQPCNCCYCTVFGHAPPLTSPVPRNFNETRERLRSILNKKKQKCKTNDQDQQPQLMMTATLNKPVPTNQPKPAVRNPPPGFQAQPTDPAKKPIQTDKKPVLTATKPIVTSSKPVFSDRKPIEANDHNYLAEKMAKMILSNEPSEGLKSQTTQTKQTGPAKPVVQQNQNEQPSTEAAKSVQPAYQQMIQQQQTQAAMQSQPPKLLPQPQLKLQQQQKMQQQLQQQMLQQQKLQQQQQQQKLQQQQLQQEQLLQQQRQARAQQQQVSVSSRDTSVFSTSSGCSGWRDGCESDDERIEDTRDLDALLQYIEGPARHVDKGKKRAKKQRQKAKKMEVRLAEELDELATELSIRKRMAASLRVEHAAAKKRVADARAALNASQPKKKGKKGKINPAQQAKVSLVAEHLGELTNLMNMTTQALQEAEKEVEESTIKLQQCEEDLREARALQGADPRKELLEQQRLQQQQEQQRIDQLRRQQELLRQQQEQQRMQLLQQQHLQQQQAAMMKVSGVYRVRRSPGDGAVTVLLPGQQDETPLDALIKANPNLQVLDVHNDCQGNQKQSEQSKKQSWEAAVAHINALATTPSGKPKEKKKKETPQDTPKETPRSQSLTDQPISKKQRKALAKQQAEEEESRRILQEAKAKKEAAKKAENAAKKVDIPFKKTETAKKKEDVTKKEETKKKEEVKKDKEVPKKGKENKVSNAASSLPTAKQQQKPQQQTQQQHQNTAKSKKKTEKVADKPKIINITPDTTIEVVNKKGGCSNERPSSCSIMEQLSHGVQVSDLRLPPGITLTRVAPSQQTPPPAIKSVPLWKCNQLPATPTPVARPAPIINADPSMMLISTAQPEPIKQMLIPEPTQPIGKSKKAKKRAKKAAQAAAENQTQSQPIQDVKKQDGTKMVTLRNPMFHPNLPPVQMGQNPQKNTKIPDNIRIPDPIPMPPNPCQATITPTSNGMYTIRNPLMSMVHQQNMMGIRPQSPQLNPLLIPQAPPQYPQTYVMNQSLYNPMQNPNTYIVDPSQISPKMEPVPEFRETNYANQSKFMNLASFTQKNEEGYSLFKPSEESNQSQFLNPDYYESNQIPKPVVSPNPIGTRPNTESNRSFESANDSSLFSNRPDPIGPPLKRPEDQINSDFSGLYTPFGKAEDRDFRSALFQPLNGADKGREELNGPNGDPLPYFQRLRVGARLNNEVTIHHVTESKYYKPGQEPPLQGDQPVAPKMEEPSIFRSYPAKTWTAGLVTPSPSNSTSSMSSEHTAQGFNYQKLAQSSGASSVYDSVSNSSSNSPQTDQLRAAEREVLERGGGDVGGYGAIGQSAGGVRRDHVSSFYPDNSVFAPDRTIKNLSELDSMERDIEQFKRFDFYFDPPKNKPKINLNVHDIAAQLKPKEK